MIADYPVLYWRSRTANGFNAFYSDVADGSVKVGPWTVFWKGDADLRKVHDIVADVAQLPPSFEGDE